MSSPEKKPNLLINESSPYLLQHAYNPVDWMPWGDVALAKAKKENKALLISIGYSACHWCHVMEHESFEDSSVAKLMNDNFICIKVDREERPDIDQIYMNAVQLMTGRGGWPLNCFATPDGRPFYGGTYFPKDNWKKILTQIDDIYKNQPEKVEEYANELTRGIRQADLIKKEKIKGKFDIEALSIGLQKWKENFDKIEGGTNYAPKFPMPNNYKFLLKYAYYKNDSTLLEQLNLSLTKMAYGGIYDQIGGGFARYSTDMEWKVPHFEKMLYDNAQLVSLYAQAYRYTKKPLYREIVEETLHFLKTELKDKSGAYYSALDADSEGEEGKYYVWKMEELKELLAKDYSLAEAYFNFNSTGLWEDGNYIPLRKESKAALAEAAGMDLDLYKKKIKELKETLYKVREKRIRPGLDDKSLCSWNALLASAYVEAYKSFAEPDYLEEARSIGHFIINNQVQKNGALFHNFKSGKASINGYLEDYSFSIEAFLNLYEVTFDSSWLEQANKLTSYCIAHYFDSQSGLFYFTSDLDPDLITRKMEVEDNVIPASNSSMALALNKLGLLLDNAEYQNMAEQMLSNMYSNFEGHLPAYSNWAQLLLQKSQPFFEVAILGPDALNVRAKMQREYQPNALYLGSEKNSKLPLLQEKYVANENYIYVCVDRACKLPTQKVDEALNQLKP